MTDKDVLFEILDDIEFEEISKIGYNSINALRGGEKYDSKT